VLRFEADPRDVEELVVESVVDRPLFDSVPLDVEELVLELVVDRPLFEFVSFAGC